MRSGIVFLRVRRRFLCVNLKEGYLSGLFVCGLTMACKEKDKEFFPKRVWMRFYNFSFQCSGSFRIRVDVGDNLGHQVEVC